MQQQQKYGLQLRVKPQQKTKKPPLPRPHLFGEDDDNVEKEIQRHASKNKSLKDVEEMHMKALEEDPSAFDYDGVYDDMKHKAAQPRLQERQERKPKYIETLMRKAEIRQREHEIIYDRKLAKERAKDDHLYGDKDKFVTSAYKRKLAEQAKWMEEERIRELKEEKEDVTKKSDLSDFYFNLGKNVAFGAKDLEAKKQQKESELRNSEKLHDEASASTADKSQSLVDSKLVKESRRDEISPPPLPTKRNIDSVDVKPVPEKQVLDSSVQEKDTTEQPKVDHHKRDDDAVARAKERFLMRKKAKHQL
ncbi:uncharacterized protein LOC126666283 [Mercurialis annua]|uniref:uncharacterized protein LOC126666283 n=1 Tax=Mercurialis annua TaxID=3986 RepID=UPI00215F85C9|nr:uncharacterized protein LOC126666283 [Mercurialis annua]